MTQRSPMTCDAVRNAAPELALGLLDGEERAHALAHLEGCSACRRDVAALAATADDLLELAPTVEPSAGFEARVLAELSRLAPPPSAPVPLPPRPRRSWQRGLLAAAAVVVLAVAGLVIRGRVVDDGGPADAVAMELADGRVVGEVALADDAASVTVTMDDWVALVRTYGAEIDEQYWLTVEHPDGTSDAHRLPPADDHPWTIRLDGDPVTRVSIADNRGTIWCSATLSR